MDPHSPIRHPRHLGVPASRRSVFRGMVGTAAAVAAAFITDQRFAAAQEGTPMTDATPAPNGSPTVVLVHGAFADASGWNGVIERLQAAGVPVVAVPNPLRSVAHDAAYVASAMTQIQGPVLVVGHSYGGAVITNVCAGLPNVVGLVYVAAFIPDEGETLLQILGDSLDSVIAPALVELTYPTGNGSETAVEYAIAAETFHDVFAADVPAEDAAVMAAAQRPIGQVCFGEETKTAAWKTLPSWAVVPTGDKAAGSDVVRSMARRAGADIVEAEGSHAIMVSQPQVVADHILTALAAVESTLIAMPAA